MHQGLARSVACCGGAALLCARLDPSLGVRNVEPKTRTAVWSHVEALTLAKTAWRHGYFGLCAVIAVAWDTSLSPVDLRGLSLSQRRERDVFHLEEGRAKTGREAIGTLSRRSVRVLDAYLAALAPAERLEHTDLPQPVRHVLLGKTRSATTFATSGRWRSART